MSHTGTQGGAAGNKAGNVIKDGAKKIHVRPSSPN